MKRNGSEIWDHKVKSYFWVILEELKTDGIFMSKKSDTTSSDTDSVIIDITKDLVFIQQATMIQIYGRHDLDSVYLVKL